MILTLTLSLDACGQLGREAAQILAQTQQRQVGGFGLQHDVEGRLAARRGQEGGELERVMMTITRSVLLSGC
jgi:hypothetical protein